MMNEIKQAQISQLILQKHVISLSIRNLNASIFIFLPPKIDFVISLSVMDEIKQAQISQLIL
jgi:hypothetical protein